MNTIDCVEMIRGSGDSLCRVICAIERLPYTAGIASDAQWAIRLARWGG